MKNQFSILIVSIFCVILIPFAGSFAQNFPQQSINQALEKRQVTSTVNRNPNPDYQSSSIGVRQHLAMVPSKLQFIKDFRKEANNVASTDTIFVGAVPNDTLYITGTFFNNGPILVFNDGVLIFENANATINGDLFVFQNAKMQADSSTLNFPQLYFYQRSWILANNGKVNVNNCTLDFTGLSHNLLAVHDAQITMNNIQNIGFTTASAYHQASISIDSTNQAGEFILNDSATFNFENVNTLLLWHTVPQNATINTTFPAPGVVMSYQLDTTTSWATGIQYNVNVQNSTDVMWALMPVNGSDITITGSTIRAIGLWFTEGDTVNVSGLVNNSNYTSFLAPVPDRVLQLNNCNVQTWSLYVFDSSSIDITGSIIGEVGSMGRSFVTAQGVLCDGSGGYYWANDTSLSIAINSTVFSSIRSQGNGIFVFGYGSVNGAVSAVGNSVMIVTQSSTPQDPIPYEKSVAWRVHINPLPVSFVDSVVEINGSAWIDQGPLGSFMDFGSYDMFFSTSSNPSTWIPISTNNTVEVKNNFLAQWNTGGLNAGSYNLRLNTFNDLGDSIDAVIQVSLLPAILGIDDNEIYDFSFSPNPVKDHFNINFEMQSVGLSSIKIYDTNGKLVYELQKSFGTGKQSWNIDPGFLNAGIYHFEFKIPGGSKSDSFVVTND